MLFALAVHHSCWYFHIITDSQGEVGFCIKITAFSENSAFFMETHSFLTMPSIEITKDVKCDTEWTETWWGVLIPEYKEKTTMLRGQEKKFSNFA